MPRDLAAAAASLAAALQLDRGRWIWLLLIVGVAAMLLAMGEEVGDMLRYDRGAIAAGGWWRLLTAHFIHLDAHHLVLNGLGLVLIWSLFGSNYDAVEWLAIAFAGALGVSCGLWWLVAGCGLVRGRVGRAAHIDGRRRRETHGPARLGSLDPRRGVLPLNSPTSASAARAAAGGDRCPCLWRAGRGLRSGLHSRWRTGYNPPPFQRRKDPLHVIGLRVPRPGISIRGHARRTCADLIAVDRGDLCGGVRRCSAMICGVVVSRVRPRP